MLILQLNKLLFLAQNFPLVKIFLKINISGMVSAKLAAWFPGTIGAAIEYTVLTELPISKSWSTTESVRTAT